MKTLVIHPYDGSTDFLARIYAPIRNKTVIKIILSKIPALFQTFIIHQKTLDNELVKVYVAHLRKSIAWLEFTLYPKARITSGL